MSEGKIHQLSVAMKMPVTRPLEMLEEDFRAGRSEAGLQRLYSMSFWVAFQIMKREGVIWRRFKDRERDIRELAKVSGRLVRNLGNEKLSPRLKAGAALAQTIVDFSDNIHSMPVGSGAPEVAAFGVACAMLSYRLTEVRGWQQIVAKYNARLESDREKQDKGRRGRVKWEVEALSVAREIQGENDCLSDFDVAAEIKRRMIEREIADGVPTVPRLQRVVSRWRRDGDLGKNAARS